MLRDSVTFIALPFLNSPLCKDEGLSLSYNRLERKDFSFSMFQRNQGRWLP